MGMQAQHVYPHACCSAVPATVTHILTCPVAAATWGALAGEAGLSHSADLFLADDRRTPSTPHQGLWQLLCLPTFTCLLAAHRKAQAQPAAQQTARAVWHSASTVTCGPSSSVTGCW